MIPLCVPDWVNEPLKHFDADRWAEQLNLAGVKDVICAAKNALGDAHYPTKVGHFVGCDVIGPLTEALHARDMRIMAYYNLHDGYMGKRHPEWRSGEHPGDGSCPMNLQEPGYQAYVLDMVEEIARDYPVDGIWFDIWSAGTQLMKDVEARVLPLRPDMAFCFNGAGGGGDELTAMVDFLSIEGHDGRTCSRHSKVLRRWRKPFELQIPENLGGWITWRPRPAPSLITLAALTAANGGTPCLGVTVAPDGHLDQGMLDDLGAMWRWIEAREQYFVGAQSWAEVGVVMSTAAFASWYWPPIGMHAALTDNHVPFDIVRPDDDFTPYRVLVLTDKMSLDKPDADRVRNYVRNGGKLLALHSSYANLEDVLGVTIEGKIDPTYRACYMTLTDPRLKKEFSGTPVCVRNEDASYLARLDGGTALAQLTLPFAPHQLPMIYYPYNPPANESTAHPTIVHHRFGGGEAIYASTSLATEIETIESDGRNSAAYHKRLVARLIGLLGGADLLQTDAPSQVEFNLMRKGNGHLVHITDCSGAEGSRFGPSLADMPLLHFQISLPLDRLGAARTVRLVPDGKAAPAFERDKRLVFDAELRLHSIYEIT